MAVAKVRTDPQWRKLSESVYQAHIRAGNDVSWWTRIWAGTTQPSTPTPVNNAPVVNNQVSTNTLDLWGWKNISKDSETYKALVAKGYDDQMIIDAYNKAKPKTTTTVSKPANLDPMAEEAKSSTTVKPAEVVPVKETKQDKPAEVVKTPEQIQAEADQIRYNDNSEARMNEITNNLNQFRTTNPNSLKDEATFRQTYSYNLRSQEQKTLLDNRYAGYKKSKELSYKDSGTLLSMYDNGEISTTDLEWLQATDPNKYAEVKALIDKSTALQQFRDMLYGKDTSLWNKADTETEWTGTIFEDYKNTINSEEVKKIQETMDTKRAEYDTLNGELLAIKEQVEKEYEGTGATTSKIAKVIADRQSEIQTKMNKLAIDVNSAVNSYNSIVNTAKETMQMAIQQEELERAETNQKMQELGFYYQYTPEWMSEMATSKYNAENPDMNSTDTATSKMALNQTLDKYYEDYGAIIQRPKAQVVNDVMNLAKSKGISVSQALKENFITPLQNKPEYKSKISKTYGMIGDQSLIDIGWVPYIQTKDANGNITFKLASSLPWMSNVSTVQWSGMSGAWLRNNNPWNIKDTTFGNVVGTDERWFATFATPEDWFDALVEKIKYNQTNTKSAYYGKTIAQYIAKYAPASDGNNPVAYAQRVASALWVNVNTKVSELDPVKFAAQIAKNDSWYDYSTYWQFRWISTGFDTAKEWLYKDYLSSYNLPTAAALKWMWLTSEQFIQQADTYKQSVWWQFETKEQQEEITKLRKEFDSLPEIKDYNKVKQMYTTVENSAKLWTAAWDLSLIFSYMKILDPWSTVREWEFANAQNAWGIEDKVRNAYNKAMKWTRLSDRQRQDFANTAKTLYQWYENTYKQKLEQYKWYAILWWDTSRIWSDIGTQTPTNDALNSRLDTWTTQITTQIWTFPL